MRIAKPFAISVLAMALMSFAVPLFPAQEPAQPQTSSPSTAADQQAQKGREEAAAAKDDKKDNKNEGDENAVFRHSSSVKLIARLFGLDPNKESDLDKAFWICMILNFIIVFGVLWFLLRKAVPAMFRNRNEAIQRRLEEARKTSEEARQRLAQVESRLSKLDTEIEQMRREAEAGALAEEKRVMEAAEEEGRRIVESAEQEITRAASAARRELKAYAAELAVDLAEKRIQITENADHGLVRDFASQLGKDGQ